MSDSINTFRRQNSHQSCRGFRQRATVSDRIAEAAVRQIELCDHHAQDVIARERARGFEILDRRDWRRVQRGKWCP